MDSDFVEGLQGLYDEVNRNDGVLTVPMTTLKELYGGYRLKSQIRQGIGEGLRYRGLDFIGDLPSTENGSVRLFIKNTPVAKIIEAVGLAGPAGDARLRQLASGNKRLKNQVETQAILRQLKAIIDKFGDDDTEDEE